MKPPLRSCNPRERTTLSGLGICHLLMADSADLGRPPPALHRKESGKRELSREGSKTVHYVSGGKFMRVAS